MTRENAHLYLPLVAALAEGKVIQANRGTEAEPMWVSLFDEVKFTCEPHLYRVAPERAAEAG